MKKVLMLHGINHNMFGKRDPAQYGYVTLNDINNSLIKLAQELEVEVSFFQTNLEGEMVDRIHQAVLENVDVVLINAGAWTHYSYGIRDALELLSVPIVEVHMSNIYKREAFRHDSVISAIVSGVIVGFGLESYLLAMRAALNMVK